MLQWAVPSFAVVLARAHTLAATLAAASSNDEGAYGGSIAVLWLGGLRLGMIIM